MAQQRRFIADAAHELRTPLTSGRVETGSGLVLTIINEIAQHFGGQVTLSYVAHQSGLYFQFKMPMH